MAVLPSIKAVLFDLDGTLVDSLPEIHYGLECLAKAHGWPVPQPLDTERMIGRGARILVQRYLDFAKLEGDVDALLKELVEYWAQSHGTRVTFYSGVIEGIKALREHGIKTAVVTNKYRDLTVEFLEEQGILDLFDTIVAGDDCEHPKPAADMVLKALSDLGVDRSEAIMVGDSRNDALAARAADVVAALVETGYNEGVSIGDWAREAGFSRVYPSAKKVCDLVVAGRF